MVIKADFLRDLKIAEVSIMLHKDGPLAVRRI